MKKRVLVTTVDTWCGVTGSDSMAVLMSGYGSENVASLSIRSDFANTDVASRYFHILEGGVFESLYSCKAKTGESYRYNPDRRNTDSAAFNQEGKRYATFRKHRWGIFILAREVMWWLGKWKSKELVEFLDEIDPEVLVCPIESYIHFNRVNEYIIKTRKPKVIGILWDDNFTYKQNHRWWHIIHRYFLRKGVKRMVKNCSVVFATSPKMKEECDKEFGINSVLLSKPVFNLKGYNPYEVNTPIRILYTGNLSVGRDKTMVKIAKALDSINHEGIKVVLDIYTNTALSDKGRAAIERQGYCTIHPPVPSSEVKGLQKNADVLLFAEAIGDNANKSARLSFSTKITDYFGAGKCIWAVGHPDLGPMNYMQRCDAALISNDDYSILSVLKNMVADTSLINKYAEKGVQCGLKNHNGEQILETLYYYIDN